MQKFTYQQIRDAYVAKGYKFFGDGVLNLNICGVRAKGRKANLFDDALFVLYKNSVGNEVIEQFAATVDPGGRELVSPSFVEAQKGGTAIMCEGQYLGAYQIGAHGSGNWRHKALLQIKPIRIYRDANHDLILDTQRDKITEGLYGINIHAAQLHGVTPTVENWSAGCQVFQVAEEWYRFMRLVTESSHKYGSVFTYTLLNEEDVCV